MGVVFDEKPLTANRARRTSFLTGLVIKTGIVKNEKGAQIVMLAITIVALLLVAGLLPGVFSTPEPVRTAPVNSNAYYMP